MTLTAIVDPDAYRVFWELHNPSLAAIAKAGPRSWIFITE
jgi:hypothetical protein